MTATSSSRAIGDGLLGDEQPTRQLIATPSGEACTYCGSPLRSDQRYCLTCGERRGRPRFPVAELASPVPPPAPLPPPAPPRVTWSGGATLVTGIATLLLAMGVGVLIGRTGQSSQKAAGPSVITVGGGASTGASTGSGSTISSTSGPSSNKHAKLKPVKGLPPKTVIVKAQAQAAKVLGGANLPPPTVKVGQKGSGPGFTNGKFTGNFFGP